MDKRRNLESVENILYKTKNKSMKDSCKKDKYHSSRYFWVNLHSYFHRGSIEVRNHSGTVDADKIINWIKILLTIKEYAAGSKLKDINKLEGTWEELIKIVKNPTLVKYMESRRKLFGK